MITCFISNKEKNRNFQLNDNLKQEIGFTLNVYLLYLIQDVNKNEDNLFQIIHDWQQLELNMDYEHQMVYDGIKEFNF
jgi:hypothetical protein